MNRLLLLALLILQWPAAAADLRTVSDPALINGVFPSRARVRVMNVWATWCAPCVAEMPDLRAIDETFGPEVALAGVSLDDMIPDTDPAKVRGFLDRYEIGFPNVFYTGNPDALGEHLRFSGEIPITIVYDGTGKELWRHQGRLEKDETIARLRRILKEMQ